MVWLKGAGHQDATIRFTAPLDGQYALDADFWHANSGGNGAVVAIYLNGILQGPMADVTDYDPNAALPVDVIRTLSMAAGDHLDIALDNAGEFSNDAVGVRALLTLTEPTSHGVPEPASLALALLALGIGGLSTKRKT